MTDVEASESQTTDIELSDSSDYKIGDLVSTFVDDDGVAVNEVFIGEWKYSGWFSRTLQTNFYKIGVTDNIATGVIYFRIKDLPINIDLNFSVYCNSFQLLTSLSNCINVSSIDFGTYFSSRIQYLPYGNYGDYLSCYNKISNDITTQTFCDKSYNGSYYIGMQAQQRFNCTQIDTGSYSKIPIKFSCKNPSVSITAYMTAEQYDSYLENSYKEEQLGTSKNILEQITGFFGSFFDNITSAISGLFIPDDGYFEDYFSRLNDFFSEKLGMLYAPVDMLVELLETISGSSGSSGIVFPKLEFDGYVIIEEQTVDLQSVADNFDGLQDALYFGTDVLMVGGVLVLLQNKLKEVLKT